MGGFAKKHFVKTNSVVSGSGQRLFRRNPNFVPRTNVGTVNRNSFAGLARSTMCGRLGHKASACRVGTNLCYYCGKPVHTSANRIARLGEGMTPQNQDQTNVNTASKPAPPPANLSPRAPNAAKRGRKPLAMGRAYALADASFEDDVLQGIIYVNQMQPI